MEFNRFEVLTFDCYGTLIDWENGALSALKPLLTKYKIEIDDKQILELFDEFDNTVKLGGYLKYRKVLKYIVHNFGDRFNFTPSEKELNFLPESIKDWQPFPDTIEALKSLKKRFKLAIISNIDDDLFAFTAKNLQVDFDWVITAEQAKSYKPSLNNFKVAFERIGLPKDKILHVAQSMYHDIIPANFLGVTSVWVNRKTSKKTSEITRVAEVTSDLEVPDLKTLAAMCSE